MGSTAIRRSLATRMGHSGRSDALDLAVVLACGLVDAGRCWQTGTMACVRVVVSCLLLVVSACAPSSDGTSDTDATVAGSSESSGGEATGTSGEEPTGSSSSSSSSGDGETTIDLPGVHFTQDVWPIVKVSCSCHVYVPQGMPPGPAAYPELGEDPAVAYLRLVDQPALGIGLDYVEPGDTAASYLFAKVTGKQLDVGGNGETMPPGVMLDADKLATIQSWIEMGALE